jgi:hypothetical protein
MGQAVDTMALFIYHHQLVMDQARLNAMYAQNASLQGRVAALEAQRLQRDPSWIPEGIDRDLVYDRGFVDAAYNPQPRLDIPHDSQPPATSGGFFHGLRTFAKWCSYIMVTIIIILVVVGVLRYFLFVKRWNY